MAGVCKSFRSRLSEPEYRKKFVYTLCLFYTFIVVGISASMTGPALLDLELITNTNTQEASFFLTGASIGSLIGCLAMGFFCARMNKVVLMSINLLASAASVTALPYCSPYILMIVLHGVVALFRATISAGGNTDLIRTWESERRIFLQILHFCFAIGSTLGPIVTQPFITPRTVSSAWESCNSTNPVSPILPYSETYNLTSSVSYHVNISERVPIDCSEGLPKTRVHFAYLITGNLFLLGFIIFIIQHCCFEHKEKRSTTPIPTSVETVSKSLPLPTYVITLAFILLFLFFLIAVESSVSSYLLTFVVKQLNWSKESGAELTSVFWGCYAAWRFATIFFTHYVPPFVLLLVSSIVLLLSTIGILLASVYGSVIGIWICIGMSGLSLSSQYPAIMMWAEESIIRLTPMIVSLIVMACTLPGVVAPLLIGYLMQQISPLWLFYIIIIMCGTCLILLLSLYTWTKCAVQPKQTLLNTINI